MQSEHISPENKINFKCIPRQKNADFNHFGKEANAIGRSICLITTISEITELENIGISLARPVRTNENSTKISPMVLDL
jgi:hypothetical protein